MGRLSRIFSFLMVLCVLAVTVQASTYSRKVSYKHQVVLRCTNKDNEIVQTVMDQPNIDIWQVRSDGTVDMRMTRRTSKIVLRYLSDLCTVLVNNVETHVSMAEENMLTEKQKLQMLLQQYSYGKDPYSSDQEEDVDEITKDWFKEYHNFASINHFYGTLSKQNPNLVRVSSIGKTSEGRQMIAVHITASKKEKPHRFYMQCLIHAREWISGSVCMYLAQKLVEDYKHNKITNLLNSMEFIIVPVVNPDGYAYTWNVNRLWRKNRVKISGSRCHGVDINRNFKSGWGQGEPRANYSCSETYHGSHAGSELETQHIMKYFKEHGPIVAAVDWHSFGQLILRPWGWNPDDCHDEARLDSLGEELSSEIKKLHGKHYTSQKSIGLYKATGIASDWFYSDDAAEHNGGFRPTSYTIELRDRGVHGFVLPKDQILPTAEEVHKAVVYLAKHTIDKPLTVQL